MMPAMRTNEESLASSSLEEFESSFPRTPLMIHSPPKPLKRQKRKFFTCPHPPEKLRESIPGERNIPPLLPFIFDTNEQTTAHSFQRVSLQPRRNTLRLFVWADREDSSSSPESTGITCHHPTVNEVRSCPKIPRCGDLSRAPVLLPMKHRNRGCLLF